MDDENEDNDGCAVGEDCMPDGVMMLLMQMLMRAVIISVKLAVEVKSTLQMQIICENKMQSKSQLKANV